jgi:hypothetical protein
MVRYISSPNSSHRFLTESLTPALSPFHPNNWRDVAVRERQRCSTASTAIGNPSVKSDGS